jgi:hypothetical protein
LELCVGGSGVAKDEYANAGKAEALSQNAQNNSASLYGTLSPTLSTMATNPQGINPADMSKIQTSNMQTAGGANAGAVGQGSLLSARTKNAGTADSAIAKSGEAASQNLSKANLSTQNENQQLKTQQQSEGLKGLQSLYGTNEGEALGGLNAANSALSEADKAKMNSDRAMWLETLQSGPNTNTSGHGASGSTSSGCFLTSACVQYAGLPDDCLQLSILRDFRDGYMSKLNNGKQLIAEYYKVAPRIVEEIDKSDERGDIYGAIFKMVIRCVGSIQSGHKKRALEIYSRHCLALKREFAGEA